MNFQRLILLDRSAIHECPSPPVPVNPKDSIATQETNNSSNREAELAIGPNSPNVF